MEENKKQRKIVEIMCENHENRESCLMDIVTGVYAKINHWGYISQATKKQAQKMLNELREKGLT